ncbi:hypothetical protein HDU82_001225, partial [Entophlyctis luteolus]
MKGGLWMGLLLVAASTVLLNVLLLVLPARDHQGLQQTLQTQTQTHHSPAPTLPHTLPHTTLLPTLLPTLPAGFRVTPPRPLRADAADAADAADSDRSSPPAPAARDAVATILTAYDPHYARAVLIHALSFTRRSPTRLSAADDAEYAVLVAPSIPHDFRAVLLRMGARVIEVPTITRAVDLPALPDHTEWLHRSLLPGGQY